MNPIEHLLISWSVAQGARLDRRDRAIVTLAGLIPDLDGFGLPFELATRGSNHELLWWTDYHHLLGHNVGFAVVTTVAAALLAHARLRTALLACLTFHLHLFGDLVGARGPDGYQWPIPYLQPFSAAWQWSWGGQWELNAWQNFAITIPLLALALWLAWKRGQSPLELLSTRANDALVRTLRQRFGQQ